MAPTKRIGGEGRVTFIKSTHAFLAKPGLDGGIFVVPSSIMGQRPGYPDMNELLSRNDLVKFEAEPQEERNGIKWVALDGSVKVIGKAAEIQYRGIGTVTKIDERYGQYGFLESDNGGIFFNANVVRPETPDITKVLKKGQRVVFEAIQQKNQPQCKYRATLVHLKNYKPPDKCAQQSAASTNSTSLQSRQQRPGITFNQISAAQPTQHLNKGPSLTHAALVKGFQVLTTASCPGSTDSSRPSTPGRAPTPPLNGNGGPSVHRSGSSSPFAAPFPAYGQVYGAPFRPIPNNQPLDIIIQQSGKVAVPKAPQTIQHSSSRGGGGLFSSAPSLVNAQEIGQNKGLDLESVGEFLRKAGVGTPSFGGVEMEDGWTEAYAREALALRELTHDHAGIRDPAQCQVCSALKK